MHMHQQFSPSLSTRNKKHQNRPIRSWWCPPNSSIRRSIWFCRVSEAYFLNESNSRVTTFPLLKNSREMVQLFYFRNRKYWPTSSEGLPLKYLFVACVICCSLWHAFKAAVHRLDGFGNLFSGFFHLCKRTRQLKKVSELALASHFWCVCGAGKRQQPTVTSSTVL